MPEKRKIVIHTIAFSPDGVSTAYLYNDIAEALSKEGYEVIILTTTPHYNVIEENILKQPLQRKWFGLFYTSNFKGMKVFHIPQKKFTSTFLRLIGFIYWHLASFFMALFQRNVHLILSPSPPLTIGFINILLKKIKGSKVIYNVQEIYPDFLIEQGGLKNKTVIKLLKNLEKFVYNESDAVTTIDQVFYYTIVTRFKDRSKLMIIPNFVDDQLYRPLNRTELHLCADMFPATRSLRVMYAGNIGHAQDWEPLIQAAIALREDPVEFFIIGEGVMRNYLADQISNYGLDKVHLLPYQQREVMPQLLAYSDLQFIFMSKDVEGHGFPSKIYTIMASSKPLLICSGKGTPIVNFLDPFKCAKIITDTSLESKVEEIVAFLRNANLDELQKMGANGYDEIVKRYTKKIVTGEYVQLVNNVLAE